jgi:hypothetical protein
MKIKSRTFLASIILLGGALSITVPLTACGNQQFNKLIKELKQHPEYQGKELDLKGYSGTSDYKVYAHENRVADNLRSAYSNKDQIESLIHIPDVTITTEEKNGHTFIPAADVDSSQGTNYDAI